MRLPLLLLFATVISLPALTPADLEALEGLGSEEFAEREAAQEYLMAVDGGDEELVGKVDDLAAGVGEAAARAGVISDFLKFGLKPGDGGEFREVVEVFKREMAAAKPEEKMQALMRLVMQVPPGRMDFLPVFRRAMRGTEGEIRRKLVGEAGSQLFRRLDKQTEAEVKFFLEMTEGFDGEALVYFLDHARDPPVLLEAFLKREDRGPVYVRWARNLRAEAANGDDPFDPVYAELFKKFDAESLKFQEDLASRDEGSIFGKALLFQGLKLPPEMLAEVRKRFTRAGSAGASDPESTRLARVMLMWGDENLATSVLDRGIKEDDWKTIHAFVITALLTGELPAWLEIYEDRLRTDPGARNRRTLAHLLSAAGRAEEGFAVLTTEDRESFVWLPLAVRLGRWDQVADFHRARLAEPAEDEREAARRLSYKFGLAFSLKEAGREEEFESLLPELTEIIPDADSSATGRHGKRLLALGELDMAIKVSKSYGWHGDVIEFLTLSHRYPEAFGYAMACAADPSRVRVAREAQLFFEGRAPEKASTLREALKAGGSLLPKRIPRPAKPEPDKEEIEALITKFSSNWVKNSDGRILVRAALKPGGEELRKRLIDLWLADGETTSYLEVVTPLLEADERWVDLAGFHFERWNGRGYDGDLLRMSGEYLSKAGQVAEGERRKRLANLMPMHHDGWREVVRWPEEKTEWSELTPLEAATMISYGGRLSQCGFFWRHRFHPLRKAGLLKEAVLFQAAGHYATAVPGYYDQSWWALDNGMLIQEGLGLDALKNGRVEEAERRLAESWSLSIQPVWMGSALVKFYREKGAEAEARRVYDTFRVRLEGYAKEMPGDERFPEKLAEWKAVCGQDD